MSTTNPGASDPALDHAYPHGHLGHLDEPQLAALAAFKKVAEKEGLYKPGPPASHDDATLLRFLRARRWIPEDALQQFSDTQAWRVANDIQVLYDTIQVPYYEQSRRMYPQWTGRRDRRGIPLYLFEIKRLDNKSIAEYERAGAGSHSSSRASTANSTSPPGLVRLFALYENLTRFVMPFCSQLRDREFAGTPITMTTNIVDITGVGLKQFWNLKEHMQAASQLATSHYPETLDRIFIIGAPFFFPTVWGWIKRWFDPITVSKIFILPAHEVESTLRQFIDPANIPKKYGGGLDFSWGDLPAVDPAWDGTVEWEAGRAGFPTGPSVWREAEGGKRLECIGVGQVAGGGDRFERICTVEKAYSWDPEAPAGVERGGDGEVVEALADGVGKLHVAGGETAAEKKALEANSGGVARSVSPALPTTVA